MIVPMGLGLCRSTTPNERGVNRLGHPLLPLRHLCMFDLFDAMKKIQSKRHSHQVLHGLIAEKTESLS